MWENVYFQKEMKQVEAARKITAYEEEFLKLYNEQNISYRFQKTHNDIFKYMEDFEIDLLAISFVGLSESYLHAFLYKSQIYINYFVVHFIYQKYNNNTSYTQESTAILERFLSENKKVSFFIDKLASHHSDYENLAFTQRLLQFIFIYSYTNLIPQEQICTLPERKLMIENLARFQESVEKLKEGNQVFDLAKSNVGSDIFNGYIQELLKIHKITKEKIDECE